jgi:transcription elongation factor Elf1
MVLLCDFCKNLSYYSLDENKHPIIMCPSCGHSTSKLTTPIIYSESFNNVVNTSTQINVFTKFDNTLLRKILYCPNCNEKTEFCLFKKDKTGKLVFLCTKCDTPFTSIIKQYKPNVDESIILEEEPLVERAEELE